MVDFVINSCKIRTKVVHFCDNFKCIPPSAIIKLCLILPLYKILLLCLVLAKNNVEVALFSTLNYRAIAR